MTANKKRRRRGASRREGLMGTALRMTSAIVARNRLLRDEAMEMAGNCAELQPHTHWMTEGERLLFELCRARRQAQLHRAILAALNWLEAPTPAAPAASRAILLH